MKVLLQEVRKREGIQRPCEFFGIPLEDIKSIKSAARMEIAICPFTGNNCTKKRHYAKESGKKVASGICSVWCSGLPYITCQNRLLENDLILKKTSREILGTDQYIDLSERGVGPYGRVDHIMGKRGPNLGEIADFFGLERVAIDTTDTRQLNNAIDDCLSEKLGKKYSFGLNFMHTLKLEIIQVILKGMIFEEWGKKYVWVLQDYLFDYLQALTGFSVKDGTNDEPIIFYLVTLKFDDVKGRYTLDEKGFKNTDVDLFKTQIRVKKKNIPKLKSFITGLEKALLTYSR